MVKNLKTIKKAAQETGASTRFLEHLLKEGLLKRHKIKSATFISMTELESIAVEVKKQKVETL